MNFSNETTDSEAKNGSDWKRQLLDPSTFSRFSQTLKDPSILRRLKNVPWTLKVEPTSEDIEEKVDDKKDEKQSAPGYASLDYLTLRRRQNVSLAEKNLHQGVNLAKQENYEQAKELYEQGLEMVPNHVDLLVALGCLYANIGQRDRAAHHLQRALDIEPDHLNAKNYLAQIQNSSRQSAFAIKSKAAQFDASVEQAFAAGDDMQPAQTKTSYTEEYPMLDESSIKHNKQREHKKKSKKRTYSHKEYDSESSTTSNDSSHRQRRRKRRKKRRKRKYQRDSSVDSDTTVDSLEHNHERQRRRKDAGKDE
jgi:tetratricopeptide (TPR) repeat protein